MGYIYCITNKVNNKKYVGLTVTTLANRFKEHRADSKRKRIKMPLYKAFEKYGLENFVIEQLEEADNEVLADREIYWIDKLNTYDSRYGYNATRGGQGGRRLYNDETRKLVIAEWEKGYSIQEIHERLGIGEVKISSYVKNLPNFKERTQEIITQRIIQARGRKVRQYTTNGEFVKEYATASEAQRELGLNNCSQIVDCCKHTNYTCKGFLWRYAEDTPPVPNTLYGKRRKVDMLDANGNCIKTFDSMTEAGKFANARAGAISDSCLHSNHKAGGYFWRYHTD